MLPKASDVTAEAYRPGSGSPFAHTGPVLTTLVPTLAGAPQAFDPFTDEGLSALLDAYEPPQPDWFRINLITSITGSAAGSDGTSETLTNRTDRRILGVVRGQSDIVLVGAESVRAEGYRIPKTTTLGIVTGSGDLSGHRIEAAETSRLVILCPERARVTAMTSLPGAQIVSVPDTDGRMTPRDILDATRSLGNRSIVCEGGPSLAAQFAAAGLVDEVCVTTSPQITGTTLPSFAERAFTPIPARLERLLVDESSALYARWFSRAAG